jgi:hypothetical protein
MTGQSPTRERLRAGALVLDAAADRPVPGERRVLLSTRSIPDRRATVRDERFIGLLAGVLAPVLRCPREEVPLLLHDALTWWRRRV